MNAVDRNPTANGPDISLTIEFYATDDMRFYSSTTKYFDSGYTIESLLGAKPRINISSLSREPIEVKLITQSNLTPTAMSHNWVLLEEEEDLEAFTNASITAMDNGYIAPEYEDRIITHTSMIGAGETDAVVFSIPNEGEYDFVCSFPGHYAGGMSGKLVITN